jgi:hypothetical protein
MVCASGGGLEVETELVRQHVGGAERHVASGGAPSPRRARPFTTSLFVPSPPATAITA